MRQAKNDKLLHEAFVLTLSPVSRKEGVHSNLWCLNQKCLSVGCCTVKWLSWLEWHVSQGWQPANACPKIGNRRLISHDTTSVSLPVSGIYGHLATSLELHYLVHIYSLLWSVSVTFLTPIAGLKYELENEDDLKDKQDFMRPDPVHYPAQSK